MIGYEYEFDYEYDFLGSFWTRNVDCEISSNSRSKPMEGHEIQTNIILRTPAKKLLVSRVVLVVNPKLLQDVSCNFFLPSSKISYSVSEATTLCQSVVPSFTSCWSITTNLWNV